MLVARIALGEGMTHWLKGQCGVFPVQQQGFMMRLQKLVVAMAITGVLGSGLASALGLGEVTLRSALNQPLDAEVELLQVGDLARNEILPSLASRGDFDRAGVKRPFSITGLKFITKVRDNGTAYIHITSSTPIQEPFLNFLMEVHWPSGRLLREYTLLLDPPAFSEQPIAPVTPATSQPYSPGQPSPRPMTPFDAPPFGEPNNYLPVPEGSFSSEFSRPAVEKMVGPEPYHQVSSPEKVLSYEVQPRDNLWSIARAVRPSGDLTVQQTMMALQRLNPKAFMRGNINELKKGEVLRIPTRAEIESMTYQDSVAEVARQNRKWKARMEQLDASRRSSADEKASDRAPDGKLTIVGVDNASGPGTDQGGSGAASGTEALQSELMMTRERLDELGRENEELKGRLKDLDEQITTLKRLITLKDDQMAALQSSATEGGSEVQQPQAQSVEPEPEVPESQSGSLMGNLLMVLAALLPLAAVAGLIVYRRRRQEEDEEEIEVDDEFEGNLPLGDDIEDDDDDLELDESLEIDESALEEEPEATVQQTQDVLSEADIYIAYGRFPQAAELLAKAIAEEPERADLHLKRLEVFAEANDLDSFRQALTALSALGDEEASRQANALTARFPDGSFGEVAAPSPATETDNFDDEPGDDLDFELDDDEESGELPDLDLDDFDLGLDEDQGGESAEENTISESMSGFEAALEDDDDLDFLAEEDEVSTKLDLARAYMDMGDQEGAREILQEVLESGSDGQQAEAQGLIDSMG